MIIENISNNDSDKSNYGNDKSNNNHNSNDITKVTFHVTLQLMLRLCFGLNGVVTVFTLAKLSPSPNSNSVGG